MEIRSAILSDLHDLLSLAARMFIEDQSFDDLGFDAYHAGLTFATALERPETYCLFVVDDDGLRGFFMGFVSRCEFSEGQEAHEKYFYIKPEDRGRGLSTPLIGSFINWAKKKGSRRINMGIQSQINEKAAVAVLEKHGFVRSGTLMTMRLD